MDEKQFHSAFILPVCPDELDEGHGVGEDANDEHDGVGQDGQSAGVGRGEGRGAQPRRREGGEGDHIDPGWGAWRRHGGYNAGYVELSGGVSVF